VRVIPGRTNICCSFHSMSPMASSACDIWTNLENLGTVRGWNDGAAGADRAPGVATTGPLIDGPAESLDAAPRSSAGRRAESTAAAKKEEARPDRSGQAATSQSLGDSATRMALRKWLRSIR
jgi:hypothetical protein